MTSTVKILFYILLLLPICGFAQLSSNQETQVDSIKELIASANHDSVIINNWQAWDNIIYATNAQLDFDLNEKIDSLATENLKKNISKVETTFFLKAKASALNIMGTFYSTRGKNDLCINAYQESIATYEKMSGEPKIAGPLNNLGLYYWNIGFPDKALELYNKSLEHCKYSGDKIGWARALNNISLIYKDGGENIKAAEYLNQSLAIQKEIGDKDGIARTLNNLGTQYQLEGDFAQAIGYYTKSLKMREEIGDFIGVSQSLSNIGIIHKLQKDTAQALDYFQKSLKASIKSGDLHSRAASTGNIGGVYYDRQLFQKAIKYYSMALGLEKELNYKNGIASYQHNIGNAYRGLGLQDSALVYYQRSFTIMEALNSVDGITTGLINLGKSFFDKKQYKKGFSLCLRSLEMAKKNHSTIRIKEASEALYNMYKAMDDPEKALSMYELYISCSDSIASEENQKEVIRQQYKYAYEKQADSIAIEQLKKDELAKAEEKRKEDLANKENEKKNLIIGTGAGGFILIILFTFFIINRLRITRKQKDLIETQKNEVEEQKNVVEKAHEQLEEKNTEIMDSIAYAKRIQSAILPPDKLVKKYLSNSFILYKPKDIVAGDFYWMETSGSKIIFAAADCTGHGVPGAMVSVICNNGLNRSVREHGLTNPGQILDNTREIVIQEFEKSEDEVKDGMDIALCSLEGTTLKYAGANNPLWIIRNGEILETKANKQPIGKYTDPIPFTTHVFELQRGDSIYIFSDGYVDQFGGEKGKKFKPANLRKLLLSMQDQSMEDQKTLLDEGFESWRGDLEQIDDVCVIGVRV